MVCSLLVVSVFNGCFHSNVVPRYHVVELIFAVIWPWLDEIFIYFLSLLAKLAYSFQAKAAVLGIFLGDDIEKLLLMCANL